MTLHLHELLLTSEFNATCDSKCCILLSWIYPIAIFTVYYLKYNKRREGSAGDRGMGSLEGSRPSTLTD